MRSRWLWTSIAGGALAVVLAFSWPRAEAATGATLPARLTDAEFWTLSQTYSEPGGTFHSENYVSNEGRFQLVIPDLLARAKQGGLYLGVGPEQNFTYIANLHPAMAFIVDIRRGNLQEHLLYKALIEMSADRADFLARLFSRARPAGLSASSTAEALFAAYHGVPASHARYAANLADVLAWLTTTPHHVALDAADRAGIDEIYRAAFYADGPDLEYQLTGGNRMSMHPTYAELMTTDDGRGTPRSYLATETNFQTVKTLEAANLIVPVVGDFGGPKALQSVGRYARAHGAVVSAFYLSNVEMYLAQDGKTAAFCRNLGELPLDEASTFIRSAPNRGRMMFGGGSDGLGMFSLSLGAMKSEVAACSTRAAR